MKYSGQPSVFDLELADVAQDRMLRRKRLRSCVTGNGTFSEEEYTELVAREVERARNLYAALRENKEDA